MEKPKRIQRKRTKGWKVPPNTKYVGRGTRFGNPFVVGKDGTAAECVSKYISMIAPYRKQEPHNSLENLLKGEALLQDIKHSLKGYNLMCWCPLDQPCHADFLLKEANEEPNA